MAIHRCGCTDLGTCDLCAPTTNAGTRRGCGGLGSSVSHCCYRWLIHGRQLANEDALLDSDELPYVAFASKLEKTDQPSCVEFKTYGSLDCKLLLHSKNTYYFFQPVPKAGEGSLKVLGSLSLYTLADSDVIGVHVLRGLNRKARIE